MSEHVQEEQQVREQHERGNKLPPLGLVAFIIFLLLCAYGFLALQGLPQEWTRQAIEVEHGDHNIEEARIERMNGMLEFRILASTQYEADGPIIDRAENEPDNTIHAEDGSRLAFWVPVAPDAVSLFEFHSPLMSRKRGNDLEVLMLSDIYNVMGADVDSIRETHDEHNQLALAFRLNDDGARRFWILTSENQVDPVQPDRVRQLGIMINGQLYSVATLVTAIGRDGIISFGARNTVKEKQQLREKIDHLMELMNGEAKKAEPLHPPYYMVVPFVLLLLAIALLPLIPATAHWWESNLHRFYVAAGLGVTTLLYYGFLSDITLAGHWPAHYEVATDAGVFNKMSVIFINAIVAEFIPFIILLFSLFTITGGIRIEGNLKASPLVNSVILFIGALLASVIGTTGAAMLLIRLLLETNKERKYKAHTVIFFIFCVCNCGGCLTPLGDPPLFLGYLRGVAFSWTFNLWVQWTFVNLILIGIYFLWDTVWYYPRESRADKTIDNMNQTGLKISGLGLHLPLLLGVVAAVAFLDPAKPLFGWHPWYFMREATQLGLCAVSLAFSYQWIRKANEFNFAAIIEVAALFFGIFLCMQAPLQILDIEGKNIVKFAEEKTGIGRPKLFFWATGSLSSVLDNAPTYVVFFETAKSLTPNSEVELMADVNEDGTPKWQQENRQWKSVDGKTKLVPVTGGFVEHALLIAVALGSVFMGAMTYIGNGPNFMIKAVAEQSGVKMPSFFGYMAYSCLLLLPLFFIVTLLFF